MKQIFYLLTMTIVSAAFVSCSDDDKTDFVVNGGLTEVSINRLGGYLEIPITASGEWTATITGNEMNELAWSDVRQTSGKGSAKLIVDVDYLDPALQIHERKAQVTIKNGTVSQVISLRQYIGLKDGESAANSGDFYRDLWHGKGVGKGYDPTTGEMSTNFVLNIKNVIDLAESDDDYATLFAQEPRPGMTVDALLSDTLESNMDSLGVHCKINVKFAKFKLGLEVDYKNGASIVEHKATYTGSQDLEYLKSTTSTADIAAILEEAWDDDNMKWVAGDSMSKKVVSTGFRSAWANVMKNRNDETKFHKAIDQILKTYGPLFVDGATLGGSIFTAIEYDSLSVDENFKVNGKLTASVALAAITISGSVSASYAKAGKDIWENSHFFCSVSGGDQASYSNLLEQLNSKQPNTETLKNAAQQWMKSINSSNDNKDNTAIISVQYTGIWNLFPFDVADDIKEYILEYYARDGKPLCINLDNMGVASTKKTK